MKTLTVRLPEDLADEIAAEAQKRGMTKSDVIRERLQTKQAPTEVPPGLEGIADLIGSVDDGLPADLSARKKHYLRVYGYGRNRSRGCIEALVRRCDTHRDWAITLPR